jgi:hypothetical protein
VHGWESFNDYAELATAQKFLPIGGCRIGNNRDGLQKIMADGQRISSGISRMRSEFDL